jgi:hypothetical protein
MARLEGVLLGLQLQSTHPENSEALTADEYTKRQSRLRKKLKRIERKLQRLQNKYWWVEALYQGGGIPSFTTL